MLVFVSMIHLYRTSAGCTTVKTDGTQSFLPKSSIDELFSLSSSDVVSISVDRLGTLTNEVE